MALISVTISMSKSQSLRRNLDKASRYTELAFSLGFAHVSRQLSRSSLSSERWFDGKWFRISNMCGPYWVLQCGWTGTKRPSHSLSSRPWLKATSSSCTWIGGPCHPRSSQTMFVRYHSMCLAVNEGYSSTTSLLACNLCTTMV